MTKCGDQKRGWDYSHLIYFNLFLFVCPFFFGFFFFHKLSSYQSYPNPEIPDIWVPFTVVPLAIRIAKNSTLLFQNITFNENLPSFAITSNVFHSNRSETMNFIKMKTMSASINIFAIHFPRCKDYN